MVAAPPSTFSLAVHGGAGTILRNTMTPAREAAYHAGLRRALEAGPWRPGAWCWPQAARRWMPSPPR